MNAQAVSGREDHWLHGSPRIIADEGADPVAGAVRWAPIKSLWIGGMTIAALAFGPVTFSASAFAVFLALTGLTLCAGHSVGMHRRFIHESFKCPRLLEYFLVWLGVLVGMAGPFGMMRQHDLRDWAQRQADCHPYLRHGRDIITDYIWQNHCDLHLVAPPRFEPDARLRNDRVYAWMERCWMAQQAPVALLLYLLGGWSFVVWGVCARVAVGVTGHWLVGFYAHHDTERADECMTWRVRGAGVQGRDVPLAGLISMGESWHNNHHAFPGSARIGLLPGQPDPGWLFIRMLKALGLATDIMTPANLPARAALTRLAGDRTGWSGVSGLRIFAPSSIPPRPRARWRTRPRPCRTW